MQKTHSSASCDNKGISSSGFRAGSSTSTKRAGSTPSASNPPSSPLQSTTTPRGYVNSPTDLWKFSLIGFVTEKFTAMLLCLTILTPLFLSKLASVIGKPIHYDDPTTNMTRLSYARVLIEVDLLGDFPNSVYVVLPNGSPLAQQVLYESLPRFCKLCHVMGHNAIACRKGSMSKHKKRP
ncbi:hypothetical protein NC652_041808 [Populus alba x Populus x berolinensis]|uniref:Uncharacterized protein n=2 Tax=Populus TaxID=3689 RepID=A0A4U5Q3W9_POPAL|nr:hypothetical protein NC652_041808 [Populus alba x Populus x berolinensis]KAJ6958755.1 hypothetical protein NC653_040405 [Populus alba x Populus x berolinensis]KAJ6958777.1 hypothetical protein NC653_040412 [Populus alba x Populus x berolinensis]TKS02795.1 hypothetical protein D5086_0000159550 [Populus alba]